MWKDRGVGVTMRCNLCKGKKFEAKTSAEMLKHLREKHNAYKMMKRTYV